MILYLPVLLYLIVIPQMNEGLELPRSILLILFCLMYLIVNPKSIFTPKKILFLPLLIPIIYLINTLFTGQNILQALFGAYKRNFGILTHLAISIIFLVSMNSKLITSNKLFKNSLLPLIGLSIIYSFIQISGNDIFLWAEKDRVLLTLGNSNFAAAYLAILLPGSIYGLTIGKNKQKLLYRGIFFVSFVLLIYCGFQTKSFQFNVIALIAVTTYLFIFYYDKFLKISIKLRTISASFLFMVAIWLVYINRVILNDFTSADDRLSTQLIGLKIFKDNFITGVGVENTSSFAQLYVTRADVQREGYDRFLDKSHNSIIDHFANGGIFLGLVYFIFLAMIFYFIYRLLNANFKLKEELALLGSIFSSYITQLFFNTDSILIMIIPHIVMGMIAKLYLEAFMQHEDSKNIPIGQPLPHLSDKKLSASIRLIACIILFSFLFLSHKIVTTDTQYRQILNGKTSTSDEILITLNNWPYPRPTEQVMVELAQNLENCALLEDVTDRLLSVNQRSSEAWFVKAVCADFKGDQRLALSHIKNAVKLHPMNVRYLDAKYQLEKALSLEIEARDTLKIIEYIGISNTMN